MDAPLTSYPIVETFHTLQGEGAWAGTGAYFLRLGGCDVHCPYCDTKESWNASRHPSRSVEFLLDLVAQARPTIVVITGGEPLLHDLTPLSQGLRQAGWRVHLETSGAHPFSGVFDWVTLSPKPFLPPHPSVYPQIHELKVVIQQEADFVWAEREAQKIPHPVQYFLQPEWHSPESMNLIVPYIQRHPRWRLSLQTHKYLKIP